jgi:uncharacterized protein
MDSDTLELVVKNHIQSQPSHTRVVDFIWHGGEPLLRGRGFYEQAFTLQTRYSVNKRIVNTIQTNGTLINNQWISLFKKHNVMVGVSIDGPAFLNDLSRIDINGESSFKKTMRGISLLKESGVEFNTLTVVNNQTARYGAMIYQTLKNAGSTYMQFQPCLDHQLDRRSEKDWSLTGEQWGQFLCNVFDQWCKNDIGKIHVQFFENCLLILMGKQSQMCHHSEVCGQQLMLEKNGDAYSCDLYHYPNNLLGNGTLQSLQSMVSNPQQRDFGNAKKSSLTQTCLKCDFLPLCNGGCPKYRSKETLDGYGESLLCTGYQHFFRYALPRLLKMVDAMNDGHSAKYYLMY